MSFEFTDSGLTIQTYQEIYDELVAVYQAAYGSDINTDPDTPDGQRIAIEAKSRLDLQSLALWVYNNMDPDLATGEALNRIIKLAGIARQPASKSQVDLTIVTDRDLTLPAGYQVRDDIGQLWETSESQALVTGSNTVTVLAQEFGAVEATAGTITEPVTVVLGVVSIMNALDATIGVNEETDAELRVRRNKSIQTPASSTVGGLFSALGNLSGVSDLIIYENDQDTTDGDLALAPHSLWIVIEGGTVADIVETIAKNKTGGTGLKGSVSGTYTESRIIPATGVIRTIDHVMYFDRPTELQLYVRLNVTRKDPSDPAPEATIKEKLAERTFLIAENVQAADLYRNVYEAGTNFIPSDLEVSDDGVTWSDIRVLAGPDGKYTLDTADITITDIT